MSLSMISISTSPRASGAAMRSAVKYWLLMDPESLTCKIKVKKSDKAVQKEHFFCQRTRHECDESPRDQS